MSPASRFPRVLPAARAAFPLVVFILFFPFAAVAQEWTLYGQSGRQPQRQPGNVDWHALNKLPPASADKVTADHFIDEESIGSSPVAAMNIIRVWEKTVFRNETKPYEQARAEVEEEEERRLGRKLTVLDMGAVFPLAVNRAAKEIRTLYEINCESREFIILEISLYDVEGSRMIREANSNLDVWYPVAPGTLMELFYDKTCRRAGFSCGRGNPVRPTALPREA